MASDFFLNKFALLKFISSTCKVRLVIEFSRSIGSLNSGPATFGSRWRNAVPWLLAAFTILFFYASMVHPYLVTGTVPGDLGDARFNAYILEHTLQRVGTRNLSYISPGMFYPYPGTIFLSDTHIGSVAFYIFFRFLGISEFPSFTLWFFTGYFLTFAASYYALLQLKFKPFVAVAAAIIFTFSLPSLAQFGHAQLVYRFGIPLAFLSLLNYLRTGLVKHVFSLIAWISLQLLCSIYTGMFLVLVLIPVAAWSLVLNRHARPLSALLRLSLLDARSFVQDPSVRRWAMLLLAAIPAIGAILLLSAYHRWSAMYGLGRGWKEIATMVPRPQSYLLMDIMPYWKAIYETFVGADVPARHEHNMFMGFGAFSLFLVGAAAIVAGNVPRYQDNLTKATLLALVSLFAVLTMFGNDTLYFFLTYIPGLNSIRSVTRIIVVLMFPVAIVVATGVDAMLQSRPRPPASLAACILLTVSLLEIFMAGHGGFPISESERRTDAIVDDARRRSTGIANPILFVMEGDEAPYKAHLDAMFAAQKLGWPTVNGYSGNGVPGATYRSTCDTPARQIAAYESWRSLHHAGPEISMAEFSSRLVYAGWPRCDSGGSTAGEPDASFGPPADPVIAKFVSLIPLALDKRGSQVVFQIAIRNKGEARIVARSFAPVRVSWRFVEAGTDQEKGNGWNPRFQIPKDILPGSDLNVTLSADLPKKPGDYRLEVSLVAEHAFWFHDEGTGILRFAQIISVP
jgi:hypothetical protein